MAMADSGADAPSIPPVSTHQKFAKDVLFVGTSTVLVALSGILTLPLITRTLGPANYGIWAQSLVTIGLVSVLAGLGLPGAMTRFLPAKTEKAEIRDDFYSALCLTSAAVLLLSIAMAAAAPFIARVFFDGATNVVRMTALITLLLSLNGMYMSLLRAFRSMKAYALFTLAEAYAQVGLIAYLVMQDYGIFSIFYGIAMTRSVFLALLVLYVGRRIGFGRPRFTNMRQYLRFGMPTITSNVSWWVVSSSDRYVIAGFLGATSVGIYSAAYGLGSVLFMVISVIGLAMPPTLSKLYDEGRTDELAITMSYSLKYFLLLAIPFVVGAAVVAEPVLRLFTTANIASQGRAVLPLIAASILVFGVYSVIANSLVLAKKTAIVGLVWIGAAAVNLVLNLILVPRVGLIGSAIGTLAAYSLALGITSHYSFKEVKFPIDWVFVLKSLAASGAMAAVLWILHPTTSTDTVIAVVTGIAVYAGALLLLRGIRRDEIAFFRGILIQRRDPSGTTRP